MEYRQNESDRVVRVSGANDPPRRLEAETDCRRPHLTPEQISIRIRQIPTPEVVSILFLFLFFFHIIFYYTPEKLL